jgi:4-amino-4-deoxy-L-arabinose transferase-like glycosyltransferase
MLSRATIAVTALAGAGLLAIALFAHPVGDIHAESDFYGGYADGARLVAHGHLDPGRYPVVGPLYECALALLSFTRLDLFLLARLLSVAAACATLFFMSRAVAKRAGALAGLSLAALLAVNPVFVHYGYSASTDMLALALVSASIFLLIGTDDARAVLAAGVLAALATLTRYSAIGLLPASVCALLFWPRPGLSKRTAALRFVLGFAIPALPWTLYSIARGHVPGLPLLQYFSFYASTDAKRSIQDLSPIAPDSLRAYRSLGAMLARDPGALVLSTLRNIPIHLAGDARDALGWPAAALAALGLAIVLARRTGAGLGALWLIGGTQLLLLAPVFHSERYSLPLLPIELTLAALALSLPLAARPLPRALGGARAVAGLVVLALTLVTCVSAQREVYRLLPTEVVEAGHDLARVAMPESRVIARKGHIGYYGGVPVVPFPRFATLQELASYARERNADFLYYSWYEAELRPEFAWLLDSTANVPGLTIISSTRHKAAMLYFISSRFGHEPSWYADAYQRRLHEARALVDVLPDSLTVPYRITLAVDALDREQYAEAIARADQALHWREDQPLAWEVKGHALARLGRPGEAIPAFERSAALSPGDGDALAWVGWAQLEAGRESDAAKTWHAALATTSNPDLLAAMEKLFTKLGDRAAADSAHARAQIKH